MVIRYDMVRCSSGTAPGVNFQHVRMDMKQDIARTVVKSGFDRQLAKLSVNSTEHGA
jgi:hypothetical protein